MWVEWASLKKRMMEEEVEEQLICFVAFLDERMEEMEQKTLRERMGGLFM